jgi:hypothetical protein
MKQIQQEDGRFSDHGKGLGTVTQAMVEQRAREIAVINGREAKNVLSSDLEEAHRELQGKDLLRPATTKADEVPEDDRWAPEGVSTGKQAPTVPAPDEQTFAEKLVEEGVADAEHEQEIEATRASLRREKEQ